MYTDPNFNDGDLYLLNGLGGFFTDDRILGGCTVYTVHYRDALIISNNGVTSYFKKCPFISLPSLI